MKTSPDSLIQALEWACHTSNLFTPELSSCMVASALPQHFLPLDYKTSELNILADRINQKQHLRLGIYYEYLWHFLLKHQPDCRLLAHNLPVRTLASGVRQTLGEFDLIYESRGKYYHRELAVKFYLGIPSDDDSLSCSPFNHWVGPGLKDRLDRKMERMLNHQILLGDSEEGAKALLDIGVEAGQKEILVQGRLFYPVNGHCPPPAHAHPDHLSGLWMTLSEFRHRYGDINNHRFLMSGKKQWISHSPEGEWLDFDELYKQLRQLNSAQYVYCYPQHLFIVPDGWPDRAESLIEGR